MSVEYYNPKVNILSSFMSETGNVFKGPDYDGFNLLLDEMELKASSSIQLIDQDNYANTVTSYDESNSVQRLSTRVKDVKRLNLTQNDVNVSSTDIVLNFTDFAVTAFNRYNVPMTLTPVTNEVLRNKYNGKVIVLTIHRFNNPNNIKAITGLERDYLEEYYERFRYTKSEQLKHNEFAQSVMFARDCWQSTDSLSKDAKTSTIKVVTSCIIPGSVLEANKTLYIASKHLNLTKDTIFEFKENPRVSDEVDLSFLKENILPGMSLMYLVDKESAIGDRYYLNNGKVDQLVRMGKEVGLRVADGLYRCRFDEDRKLVIEEHVPIQEVERLNYLYRTKEEATHGVDRQAIRQEAIRDREMENRENELFLNAQILKLKQEQEQLKLAHAAELNQLTLQATEKKAQIETIQLRDKHDYESRSRRVKHYYDERAYDRSDAADSWKFTLAIAGIATAGLAMYMKMNASK